MLHSLSAHHPAGRVHVHFLYDATMPSSVLEELGCFARGLGLQWHGLEVPSKRAQCFPDDPRFGRSAWYRVLLPELLPDVDRVLYLDADMIVAAPLDDLWSLDMSRHPVGAVTNPLYPWMSSDFLIPLGVPRIVDYFNSGMLLMHLDCWRDASLVDDVSAFVERGIGLDAWPDQNVLNAVLWRRRLPLPPRWNSMSVVFDLDDEQLPYSAEEIDAARHDPAVIHYNGPYKPSHYRSKHPYRRLYFEHLEQTPWRDAPIEGRTLQNVLLRPLPWLVGLRVERAVVRTGWWLRRRKG